MSTRPQPPTAELRLADVATFLGVLRLGSIQGAARALNVTASQVSKAVARLERHLGTRLLVRSERGIVATEAANALAPRLEELLTRADALQSIGRRAETELTIVGSAFMNRLFLPAVVEALSGQRVRSLEMPPGVAGAYASDPFFDVALTASDELWPESWVKTTIGTLRQGVFASPALAARLGPPPVSIERLREAKFIVPIYSFRGRVMSGDDGCPLPLGERQIGHETQTLALALALAERADQLVFAPAIAAGGRVESGALVEVEVEGWSAHETLQLVCHGERVNAQVQRAIVGAVRKVLGAFPAVATTPPPTADLDPTATTPPPALDAATDPPRRSSQAG